jgi:phosphoribosylformylglycinamidine (FGAM) synthase-like amidotransferase family enzyme
MKSAVIVFPGSNCDRDLGVALEQVTGRKPDMVWHKEMELAQEQWRRARPSCARSPRQQLAGCR